MNHSHCFNVGEFQCLAINDGDMTGSADLLFANAPENQLRQVLQRYKLKPDRLPSTWTCLLIKTAANLLLIDTGIGIGEQSGGRLIPVLQAEGFQPEDIDTVILTHAHPDHIGGCVDATGKPSFPNANYHMWHDEWDFWTTESTLQMAPEWAANMARKNLPPIADHLVKINSETDIVPGIRAIAAAGHTAGHIIVEVESGGESLFNIADAALHHVQIEYPEWYSRLDQFPEQAVAARQAIYQEAAKKNALVLGFHFFPFPSLGHIISSGQRYFWQPIDQTR